LRPLALAEFWWGSSPSASPRRAGFFYPACRNKCSPLLSFMLAGLTVAQARHLAWHSRTAPLPLSILYEDESLLIVDKPAGLLAIPGRSDESRDSVLSRVGASHPDATGPVIVHRLDMDTSGLMVVTKDATSHAALQRQFARREVVKEYAAWLDGAIPGERGQIDFPMRVDLDDRPRQIYDPVWGRSAITDWRVEARSGERTRVIFFPRTGRTHQLRLHAAHPLGLGTPIVGDPLYGRAGERMLLHAQALTFVHPRSGRTMSFRCPSPF
jgi:tRNA pseudouridine32 synthase/23S rRNA pseudouridine746 synthase